MQLYVYRCPECPAAVGHQLAETAAPYCLGPGHRALMLRVPDTARALLAFEAAPSIGPLKVATLKSAGILVPETQHALEWLYRNRKVNGMAGAFLVIGGRRCIDLVAFARLMREQRA